MKIQEIAEKPMPHLYLDMDGVQADFFGAWAKMHNVEHWKALADKENEINILAHSSPENVYNFFAKLEPLKMSSTMSNKPGGGQAGRPEKPDDQKSDKTLANESSMEG